MENKLQAREMMLNNYVLCRGAISKVTAILESQIGYKKLDGKGEPSLPMKYVKPIPLTETELVKFGFEKHHISNLLYEMKYTALAVKRWENDFIVFWGSTATLVEIKYIHQLQNLFFILTGQELTYK